MALQVAFYVVIASWAAYLLYKFFSWFIRTEQGEKLFVLESDGPLPARDTLIVSRRLERFEKWVGHCTRKLTVNADRKIDIEFILDRTGTNAEDDDIYRDDYFEAMTEKLRADVLLGYTSFYHSVHYRVYFKGQVCKFYSFYISSGQLAEK